MFMKECMGLALSAALVFAVSTTSNAATVEFDLTDPIGVTTPGNFEQLSYEVDGVGLKVTAPDDTVHVNGNGVGVTGSPEGGELALDEELFFEFDPEVVLLSALVIEVGKEHERFDISFNGSDIVHTIRLVGEKQSEERQLHTIDLSAYQDGLTSSFTLFGYGKEDADDSRGIRVAGLTVSTVPLPAAGLLLISALGGMAYMGRKRS